MKNAAFPSIGQYDEVRAYANVQLFLLRVEALRVVKEAMLQYSYCYQLQALFQILPWPRQRQGYLRLPPGHHSLWLLIFRRFLTGRIDHHPKDDNIPLHQAKYHLAGSTATLGVNRIHHSARRFNNFSARSAYHPKPAIPK